MGSDLFINSLILIAFIFISGNIAKDIECEKCKRLSYKIILGIFGGVVGALIMFYNIKITNTNIMVDVRVLVLMMVNYLGGMVPTIVTGIILSIYRMLYNGINQASVVAIISIVAYLLTFKIIDKTLSDNFKKWFVKLISVLLITVGSLYYLLNSNEDMIQIIAYLSIAVLLVGSLEFFLLEYVRKSNEALRMYKENATKDYLTGLNNARNFDSLINNSFKIALEKNEKLSCLMIDIDHFKKVNDTYGHAVGDIVIKELGCILSKTCRKFDIIGRVGGEEFCIILLDCTEERALEIGERIRKAVKEQNVAIGNNKVINITVSIGIATYPDTVESLEVLKEEADKALYVAKQSGRDKIGGNKTEFCNKYNGYN